MTFPVAPVCARLGSSVVCFTTHPLCVDLLALGYCGYQSLDEEWRNKVDEEILKLRSTLKEKLSKFGFNPEGELW